MPKILSRNDEEEEKIEIQPRSTHTILRRGALNRPKYVWIDGRRYERCDPRAIRQRIMDDVGRLVYGEGYKYKE